MSGKRHSLALLLAISAAPVGSAWLLFLNPHWLPEGSSQHGELVQPPAPMGTLSLDTTGESAVALAAFSGKWLLLLSTATCQADCLDLLWAMRQVRLAVGIERQRVARLLLLGRPPGDALGETLAHDFPSMPVEVLSQRGNSRWRAIGGDVEGLYLVDPMGNLMMRYPIDIRPEALLSDLERLLKASKHWRTHARD